MRRLAACILLLLIPPAPAFAHGFGQRYDLPVPLWLYLYGASAAVLLSFVLVVLFVGRIGEPRDYPRFNLLSSRLFRATLASRPFVSGLRILSVVLFALVIVSGLFGDQGSRVNFAPTFVWILFWVGTGVFTAFVGNIWAVMNPWKNLFEWADRLVRKTGDEGLELNRPYPASWDVGPAMILFFAFVWIELVSGASSTPRNIAILALLYSSVTWAGMAFFGKAAWLRRGEFFSVFFGVLARFAPTEARTAGGGRELNLRPPAVGLLASEGRSVGMMVFVVFMLAGVTYDGLIATPPWAELLNVLFPLVEPLGRLGVFIYGTLGLLAVALVFVSVYLSFVKLCQLFGGGGSLKELAAAFAYSLVPIALAYQIAHYYTLLLVEGQLIFSLVSDPLGRGWNLFGTADIGVDVGVVGAAFVWYSQVALIVAGHVVAVYLSHATSLRVMPTPKLALRSQYPMIALMILFTVFSLWLLSQTVV